MEKSPRKPASLRAGFKSVTRFTLAGQPGPACINRAKIGPGQNGPGWPVLTSLYVGLLIDVYAYVNGCILRVGFFVVVCYVEEPYVVFGI